MKQSELSNKKIKKRMEQAKEMELIWEDNDKIAQAYLKGCISTVVALVSEKIAEEKPYGITKR